MHRLHIYSTVYSVDYQALGWNQAFVLPMSHTILKGQGQGCSSHPLKTPETADPVDRDARTFKADGTGLTGLGSGQVSSRCTPHYNSTSDT